VLAEGMVSYLQDTNTLEVYDGSAWIGATGDITALTAGTGVSITNPTGPVPTVAIDTAVTADLTTAQTLTNKTLTSPVLTTPSISNINAKGDILVGTADNTLGIITAGNNGDTLVADSSTGTGLRYKEDYAAGKNRILNSDFSIWQRGTSFNLSSVTGYTADRWQVTWNGSGATRTISQQTFTPGTAPVAGYEGTFFWRYAQTVAGTGGSGNFFFQPIENVRTFAGQTVTASFYAKADAARSVPIALEQNFGSGGSGTVSTSLGTASLTTSWTRFTFTVAVPSISGKTIGTSSYLNFLMTFPANTVQTIDIWGVQLEQGSTATAFQTATGTIQGELAACQRYYYRMTSNWGGLYANFGTATGISGTTAYSFTTVPVTMRVAPTSVDYSTLRIWTGSATAYAVNSVVLTNFWTAPYQIGVTITVTSGLTDNQFYFVGSENSSSGYLGFSAEL
jgi:hypothetical protein